MDEPFHSSIPRFSNEFHPLLLLHYRLLDARGPHGLGHGINWLGDEDQREELNELKEGADYGWPYVYADGKIPPHPQPAGETPEQYAAKTVKPVQLYAAQASPLGMVFNSAAQFSQEYRNDAFVTMHGSWNRAQPPGYRIVRVRFDAKGRATGMEDFVTGSARSEEWATPGSWFAGHG